MNKNEIILLNEVIERLREHKYKGSSLSEFAQISNNSTERNISIIQSLLPKEEAIDWSKASDEQKLEYAKKHYPKGTKYIPIGLTDFVISKGNFHWSCNEIEEVDEIGEPILINGEYYRTVYFSNRWAEIVEEPEQSEPRLIEVPKDQQDESKKHNPTMTFGDEPSQEIKELLVGYEGEVNKHIYSDNGVSWIWKDGQGFGRLVITNKLTPVKKTTPEIDEEIKAGDRMIYEHEDIDYNHNAAIIKEEVKVLFVCPENEYILIDGEQSKFTLVHESNLKKLKPTKTQEEMDREKAEEIFNEMRSQLDGLFFQSEMEKSFIIEVLMPEAINYGRKTK